ncbi:MAG: putative metal-binding motif-containing protein, partial [Myxococcales bacterium]|nr:putative metal-binding motif-containing protein [Myxococcales bacterium]
LAIGETCSGGPLALAPRTDCDDGMSSINPSGTEQCDPEMRDEDCDGTANPVSLCECTNGQLRPCPLPGVCGTSSQTCMNGAWGSCGVSPSNETCNGLDDDCDGMTDDEPDATTSCGSVAHTTFACASPSCEIASCDMGWGACDSSVGNGCETSLDTTSHCGACNAYCLPGASCTPSGCRPGLVWARKF